MDRYHRSTGHSRPARRHARRRGGRGQSLVEFALAVPLFLALLTGSLEMGMLFKSHSAYQEATQEAVRAGSAVGATDQDALDELKTILSAENLNNIQSVTVFDATVSDTVPTVPDTYTNYVYDRTFNGSGGFVCGAIAAGRIVKIVPSQAPPCPTYANRGAGYSYWDPNVRNATTGHLDRVGIQVTYQYKSLTGIFRPLTLTQVASVQMEPSSYGS